MRGPVCVFASFVLCVRVYPVRVCLWVCACVCVCVCVRVCVCTEPDSGDGGALQPGCRYHPSPCHWPRGCWDSSRQFLSARRQELHPNSQTQDPLSTVAHNGKSLTLQCGRKAPEFSCLAVACTSHGLPDHKELTVPQGTKHGGLQELVTDRRGMMHIWTPVKDVTSTF